MDEPIQELEVAGDLLQQRAEPETAGTGAVDDLLKRMTAKERYVGADPGRLCCRFCSGVEGWQQQRRQHASAAWGWQDG